MNEAANNPINNSAINNTTDKRSSTPHNSAMWWQMPVVKIVVALLGTAAILIMMNVSITKYETQLAEGEVILLELAPVDPRGFMQGDYMALDFAIANRIVGERRAMRSHEQMLEQDGYVIVKKDAHAVGHFERLMAKDALATTTLAADEMPLYYRVREAQVKFATNAFFFQEGDAKAYNRAEYGLFKVNDKGELLLTNLVDDEYRVIETTDQDAGF